MIDLELYIGELGLLIFICRLSGWQLGALHADRRELTHVCGKGFGDAMIRFYAFLQG